MPAWQHSPTLRQRLVDGGTCQVRCFPTCLFPMLTPRALTGRNWPTPQYPALAARRSATMAAQSRCGDCGGHDYGNCGCSVTAT